MVGLMGGAGGEGSSTVGSISVIGVGTFFSIVASFESARGRYCPKPLSTSSSTGSMFVARLARITRSHIGSSFFQPPAYATCRARSDQRSFVAAPRAIEPQR